MTSTPLDNLATDTCWCFADEDQGCMCPAGERALRRLTTGRGVMTDAQREWCFAEIDKVEGFSRADFEGLEDKYVAGGVLNAWTDYCRDKGLL